MKRLLFVGLMMICSVSWAEWELCSINGQGDDIITFRCDKSTIRTNGAISRMWDIRNYTKAQTDSIGDSRMSSKTLTAYNCKEETSAIISYVDYSGRNGKGNVIQHFSVQERELKWTPIVPGTTEETLWNIACGKK